MLMIRIGVWFLFTHSHTTAGLKGEILINGKEVSASDMKKYSAYVMQDDALYGVLTVRENLYYSAALRLPESMSIKGGCFALHF